MKVLKFRDNLVPLVLSGEKNSTWRLFDDKDLTVGDDIELQVFVTNNKFAEAKIVEVIEKRFGDLSDDDKKVMRSLRMTLKCMRLIPNTMTCKLTPVL